MNSIHIRGMLNLCLIFLAGCTPVSTEPPPATLERQVTTPPLPTITPSESLDIIDIPQARSLAMTGDANGNLYLIYGKDHSLFVTQSTDGGQTFSEAVLATGHSSVHILPVERPAIAADSENRVGIAWLELPPDFNGATIWYALSEDGGQTFGDGHLVATEPEGEVAMVEVVLDSNGNPILAWLNGSKLKFARSHDQGMTFTEAQSIGDGSCECCQPSIVLENDNVYIAYRGLEPSEDGDIRDIVLIRSEDGGATFQPVTRVSDTHWYLPACPIAGPSMTLHAGTLYVAWMDGRFEPQGTFSRGDIWLASSVDGGASFSANIRINATQDMHHTLPVIAFGPGGRLHLAWEALSQGGGNNYLYYTTSDDGGLTFAAPQIIADNTDSARGTPGKPVLTVDQEGRVTLAWLDRTGARITAWSDPQ